MNCAHENKWLGKNKSWAYPVLHAKMVLSVRHNMRKEYDFSKGVRGKYAKKYKGGTKDRFAGPGRSQGI